MSSMIEEYEYEHLNTWHEEASNTVRKGLLVPFCPPQIPHEFALDLT